MKIGIILLAAILASTPSAVGGPIYLEECQVLGSGWANCHGYLALDGAGGIPIEEGEFGIVTSGACGGVDPEALTEPRTPDASGCTARVALVAATADAATPNAVPRTELRVCPEGAEAAVGCALVFATAIDGANGNGRGTTCALLVNQNIVCWGYRNYTRGGGDAVGVSSGGSYACAVLESGNVDCFGPGELCCDGQAKDYLGGDAVAVSTSGRHTCVLRENGRVHCYGENHSGAVIDYNAGDASAVETAAGRTCILKISKNVACFGETSGFTAWNGGDVIQISLGIYFTCLLFENGNVACFGESWSGGSPPEEYTAGDATAVATYHFVTCVLTRASMVVCWGNERYQPDELFVGATAISIASYYGPCALLASGSVQCDTGQQGSEPSGDQDYDPVLDVTPTLGSESILHAGGMEAVRGRVDLRVDQGIAWQEGNARMSALVGAVDAATAGNLLPLLSEVLRLQDPPAVFAFLYGPDGLVQVQADADSTRTPHCYGIHSDSFAGPLQSCSDLLP